MTISRWRAVMTILEDLNWQFKLLQIIILIIFRDKKDFPWQMDFIQRQLTKTNWTSSFPTKHKTVCQKYFKFNFENELFFFRNHFELHIEHWFIGYWFWTILLPSGPFKLPIVGWLMKNSLKVLIFDFQLRRRFDPIPMSLFKKCVGDSRYVNYRYSNWRCWRYRRIVLFYVDQCWWTWRQYWSNNNT